MPTVKKILVIVALAAAIFVAAYFSNALFVKNEGVVTIGSISILSGEYAAIGQNISNGMLLAKETWNAEHGDLQFEIISEDDGFDAKKGMSAYQKLMTIDKVMALINTSSPTIDAIYADVSKKDMPVIQFGNQGVEPTDDNVFQLTPGNAPLEIALGNEVTKKYGTNIALFYGNDSVFSKFASDFKKGYSGTFTEYKDSVSGEDPRAIATKIIAQKPSAVVIIATPTSGAKLVKEITSLSKEKIPFVFDASMQTGINDYIRIIGNKNVLDGSLVMTVESSQNAGFESAYEKRWGAKPGVGSSWGYDGFMALAKGYDKSGKVWTNKLKKINFPGASGEIVFDNSGVLLPAFSLKVLQNGNLVPAK